MESESSDRHGFRNELRRLQGADPFVPFEIVVSSGDVLKVVDPIELVIGPDMVRLIYARPEKTEVVRINQLVLIRVSAKD